MISLFIDRKLLRKRVQTIRRDFLRVQPLSVPISRLHRLEERKKCSAKSVVQHRLHVRHYHPSFLYSERQRISAIINENSNEDKDEGTRAGLDSYEEEEVEDSERLPFADDDEQVEETADQGILPIIGTEKEPLMQLNEYYRDNHGYKRGVTEYINSESKWFPESRAFCWTATFTCPVTDTVYHAGTRKGVTARDAESGCIFFARKVDARHAAAGRALDIIQFQRLGITEPRLCEEDPSAGITSTMILNTDTIGTPLESDTSSHELTEEVKLIDEVGPLFSTTVPSTTVSTKSRTQGSESAATITISDNDQESDTDEYVVCNIPANERSTLPAKSILNFANEPLQSSMKSSMTYLSFSPQEHLNNVIQMAKAWAEMHGKVGSTESKNPHRVVLPLMDSTSTLTVGKNLLFALAEARQQIPVTISYDQTEYEARRVFDRLVDAGRGKPDTTSCNLLLKCFCGKNRIQIAKRAEQFVENMRQQKKWFGAELPKPDMVTINTLIQLWAQCGGKTGKFDRIPDDWFKPDRESFLAILSSEAYNPEREDESKIFDINFARQCVDRMKELTDENPHAGKDMTPDTQIMNAPLKWSGGFKWKVTRPYARYTHWDNYELLFSEGFVEYDESSDAVQNALRIQQWIEEMSTRYQDTCRSDIETFEALVQAWINTKTLEGVERAEKIATDLLNTHDSRTRPRLQTFHPILSAWLYSKRPESLTRLRYWMDVLEARGESMSEVLPDSRLLNAYISACVAEQNRLFGDLNKIDSEEMSAVGDLAKSCSVVLQRLCDRFYAMNSSQQHEFIQTAAFSQTIKAWENDAIYSIRTQQQSKLEHALVEMARTIASFENCCQLAASQESLVDRDAGRQQLSNQLRVFLDSAPWVYGIYLQSLQAIFREGDQISMDQRLCSRILGLLEGYCRRYAEIRAIEQHRSQGSENVAVDGSTKTILGHSIVPIHSDLYVYSLKDDAVFKCNFHQFLWRMIKLLEKMSHQTNHPGDVMRLCILLCYLVDSQGGTSKHRQSLIAIIEQISPQKKHCISINTGRATNSINNDDIDTKDLFKRRASKKSGKPAENFSLRNKRSRVQSRATS